MTKHIATLAKAATAAMFLLIFRLAKPEALPAAET
jgi:hypothetical protein